MQRRSNSQYSAPMQVRERKPYPETHQEVAFRIKLNTFYEFLMSFDRNDNGNVVYVEHPNCLLTKKKVALVSLDIS